MQQKTSHPVQFEITPPTRDAVSEWIKEADLSNDDYLFLSRVHDSPHFGTRQYARILDSWIEEIGLDPTAYGTHTMRRTKASLISGARRTFGQCYCCWDTLSWKARCGIWALKWKMLLSYWSRLKSEEYSRIGNLRIN